MPAPITPIKRSGSGQKCTFLPLSSGEFPMRVALCKGARMIFGKPGGGNRTQTALTFSRCSKRNSTSALPERLNNNTYYILPWPSHMSHP
jgi:hypothetical protein